MAICDNINDTGGGNGEISEVNNNGSTPVLIGDSWATRMKVHFSGESVAVASSKIATDSSKYKSAKTQITEYLKKNPKPKFILCYSGRNDAITDSSKAESQYVELIKACNDNPIYIIQEQYDCHPSTCEKGDKHIQKCINALNAGMESACKKYNNATMLKVTDVKGFRAVDISTGTSEYMNCCINSGCGCGGKDKDGFHMKMGGSNNGNKLLLKAALEMIGQTSYLK